MCKRPFILPRARPSLPDPEPSFPEGVKWLIFKSQKDL